MDKGRVLIAGASIAGPALAFWLVRAGFEVTVVELSPELRQGGNGVDIREQALFVAQRMGLLDRFRAHALGALGMRFVDVDGREMAAIGMQSAAGDANEDVEVARGDVAHILHDVTRHDVEYVFGDTIGSMAPDESGVDVSFERGAPRRFDLVVGADGLHSRVRRLAFGPESEFVRFKEHYFATAGVETRLGRSRWISFYNSPGKAVGLYRGDDRRALVNFAFRSARPIAYEYRDLPAQRQLVHAAFAGADWYPTELLAGAEAAPDFYFDALCQVRMPSWTRGRVTLVGDAAYCASPASGAGALLSLVGAYRLAGELAAAGDDLVLGLSRYEAAHRPLVMAKQAALFTGLLMPKTRPGIWLRNLLVRSPLLKGLSGLQTRRLAELPRYDFSKPALA